MTETVDRTRPPGHYGLMFGQKKQLPRKPLRERVADRKAGRKETAAPHSARKKKYTRWAKLAANGLQALGVLILLLVVVRFTNNNVEYIEELVAAAAGVFLLGRFSLILLKSF